MMLAALLGTMYFVYVQFAITWYGNLPHKVEWYATRMLGLWPLVAAAAFSLGAVAPFFMFTSPDVRHGRAALRVAGMCVARRHRAARRVDDRTLIRRRDAVAGGNRRGRDCLCACWAPGAHPHLQDRRPDHGRA